MAYTSSSMWRFRERLPGLDDGSIVSLGEGGTPVLDLSASLGASLGLDGLWLKCEHLNPTGSFKARIASVAYSLVTDRGLRGAVGTSSGNGGAAAAAYAAAAKSSVLLFTLADILPTKMREISAVGGSAFRIDGIGHTSESTARVASAVFDAARVGEYYPFLTGFHYAPEAMAGVKTIAWELLEQTPDATVVYSPIGGGGLVTGLGLGYREVEQSLPRIVAVHPEGANSLPLALAGVRTGMTEPVTTGVSGLQMAVLYDTEGAVRATTESGGHARSVSDDEIVSTQRLLAREHGLLVEAAGATAVAGIIADVRDGRLGAGDRAVAILSGAGYKDLMEVSDVTLDAQAPLVSEGDIARILSERQEVQR